MVHFYSSKHIDKLSRHDSFNIFINGLRLPLSYFLMRSYAVKPQLKNTFNLGVSALPPSDNLGTHTV